MQNSQLALNVAFILAWLALLMASSLPMMATTCSNITLVIRHLSSNTVNPTNPTSDISCCKLLTRYGVRLVIGFIDHILTRNCNTTDTLDT
jgi:hypothetical protein